MNTQAAAPVAEQQKTFASPEEAATALIATVKAKDHAGLLAIFGAEAEPLLNSGDPVEDAATRDRFATAFDEKHHFEQTAEKAVLVIGKDDWPFPIPLAKDAAAWHFDTAAGADEIIDRRIGENETSTIMTMLAYVDAQIEYADIQRGAAPAAYAQRILSTPGKHDGLYWPTAEGQPPSPLGPLVASARGEGYRQSNSGERVPYHGYYFKILTGQGVAATGGIADYIVNGRMIGGFGLVAWPAQYGDSGVKTFIVNHEGTVYEKDVGATTGTAGPAMIRYDPDSSWHKVEIAEPQR